MKARLFIITLAIAAIAIPSSAHAGAAQATCSPGGLLVFESTDSALIEFSQLWDFQVRSVTANGVSVPFHLSSGSADFERFTADVPIPAGQVVAFEFRQVRNLTEGGDGFASTWTTHTREAPACALPPTTTEATTTTPAPSTTVSTTTTGPTTTGPTTTGPTTSGPTPTTASGPTTTGSGVTISNVPTVPSLPTLTFQATSTNDLPITGGDSLGLVAAAAMLIVAGSIIVFATNRPGN